jgi:hypothetical protein
MLLDGNISVVGWSPDRPTSPTEGLHSHPRRHIDAK